MHNAFVFWPAAQADVEKAAESEPQQSGKNGHESANHAWLEYKVSHRCLVGKKRDPRAVD